jgi:8-hydroxy-5-deazaflavin:NADPH oxidoreductase
LWDRHASQQTNGEWFPITLIEQLIRDAGFDPIHLGDLGQAPLLEGLVALTRVLGNGELGPFFYRFNRPGELSGK